MDMSTRHIKITAKEQILQVLKSAPWPLYALDIADKGKLDPLDVHANLSRMMQESPPPIARLKKRGGYFQYIARETMDSKKVVALTVSQDVLDAIFESIDEDDRRDVIGTHCKMLKVLRQELEARSMNQTEE